MLTGHSDSRNHLAGFLSALVMNSTATKSGLLRLKYKFMDFFFSVNIEAVFICSNN